MKILLTLCLLLPLLAVKVALADDPAPPTPPSKAIWLRTFDDEFDNTDKLDTNKWTPVTGTYEMSQTWECAYTPSAITVQDGFLRITSTKRDWGKFHYTSGEIRTIGKFQQRYGRFEVRVRLPKGHGVWPATYLLPADGTWPPEIDVCESLDGETKTLCMSDHWGTTVSTHGGGGDFFVLPKDFDFSQWHTVTVDWEPGAISWYIDGKLEFTTDASLPVSDVPMVLRINTMLTSAWGDWTKASYPVYHDVDYVRIYRRADQPIPVVAGPDHEITLPKNTVDLVGLSCNPMETATATWSVAEGPASVTWQDAHALSTRVTFHAPGMYVLRLSVSQEGTTSFDETKVYVNAP